MSDNILIIINKFLLLINFNMIINVPQLREIYNFVIFNFNFNYNS